MVCRLCLFCGVMMGADPSISLFVQLAICILDHTDIKNHSHMKMKMMILMVMMKMSVVLTCMNWMCHAS